MKAFVEILSGIVRVGEDCDRYGKPYDGAVVFSSADGRHAVIKGLTAYGPKTLTVAHAKAAFRAIKDIGLIPIWERIR